MGKLGTLLTRMKPKPKKEVATRKRKRKPPLEIEARQAGRGKGIKAAKDYLYKKDKKGNFELVHQTDPFGDYTGKRMYTFKSRVKPKTILKAADVAIGAGGALAIKKATEGNSKMDKKYGGVIKKGKGGAFVKRKLAKTVTDTIIKRYARDHGKAAAIKKYGADRVAKVPMSKKTYGTKPTKSRAGEGDFGISGSYQTRQPRLLPDDSWVVRGGTGGGRKSGGRITYKMTGGQVVDHGYD